MSSIFALVAATKTVLGAALVVALVAIASWSSPAHVAQAGPNCDADTTIDSQEQALFQLINDYRAGNGLNRLVFSDALNRAAAWKSEHMAANDYFGHDDVGFNRDFVGRLPVCGYTANTWLAETIATGHDTAAATFEQWRTSPVHSAIMLDPNMVAIGVARASDAGSEVRWYWTVEFGGVADNFTPPPPTSLPDDTGDTNCDGVVNPLDAALILQFAAGLVGSLLCQPNADVDSNGRIDVVDAAIILQFSAGLLGSLPP